MQILNFFEVINIEIWIKKYFCKLNKKKNELFKDVIISYNKNLIFGGMKYGKID